MENLSVVKSLGISSGGSLLEWRITVNRIILFFILCLSLWGSFGEIGYGQKVQAKRFLKPQQKLDSDTARHYILLLDGTGSFRRAIKNSSYYSYIQEILQREPNQIHDNYQPYRPGRDIVSIVFFHFSLERKDWNNSNDGLYTSIPLALVTKGIDSSANEIESFVTDHSNVFQKTAVSPIGLSEICVLPFLNEYIRSNGLTINQRIDKVYLISLSDEVYNVEAAGLKSSLGSIRSEPAKAYYVKLRDYMESNFENLLLLKNIEKPLPPINGIEKKIYFHYYEILPRVRDVKLNLSNKVALARAAQKNKESGTVAMTWAGNNEVCLDNQTEYRAWVEWTLPRGVKSEWIWHNCAGNEQGKTDDLLILSAGCRAECGGSNAKPLVQIVKEMTSGNPVEEAQKFKMSIWYRGAVDLPIKNQQYGYPFESRCYINPTMVEYVSNEVADNGEGKVPNYYSYNVPWYSPVNLLAFFNSRIKKESITDRMIKDKLVDEGFPVTLAGYIQKDKLPKRFKEYCDSYRGKTITQLPAEILSEASNIQAQNLENWAKWRTLIFYLLCVAFIIFVYRYFLRPIAIRLNIDPAIFANNTILVDFSNYERKKDDLETEADSTSEKKKEELIAKKEVLATFDLENLVNSWHPDKRNPKFKFSFNLSCEFSYPGEPLNVVYENENLLSLMDKTSGTEYPIKTSGNSFYATLSDVYCNRKFALLINLNEIKDIETENIGDKLIPFTLTLTSPEARTDSDKTLPIQKMKVGAVENSQKQWEYSVNLHIKPEQQQKKFMIISMPGTFASIDAHTSPHPRENYVLNYTSKKPLVKLFEVVIKNTNKYHFSYPVEGTFNCSITGAGNKQVDNIFYMSEREVSSTSGGGFPRAVPIRLKKSEGQKKFYLYIHFDDFTNPLDHWDYTITNSFKHDIVKTLNIRVNRSKEETEALLQIVDDADAILMDIGENKCLTDDNSLLVNKNMNKSFQTTLRIPAKGVKGIKEGVDTKLFTLHLKNNCCTKTGYYNWNLKNLVLEGAGEGIKFEDNPIKWIPNGNSGTIIDQQDSKHQIDFCMDHSKIKKVNTYYFGFTLKFSICIQLFPTGDTSQAPAGGEKQIDFSVQFLCYHDVKDNYLVVDFGTSAICAYYYTHNSDTPSENYRRIPLNSPKDHLSSEDDLLPSIINLRNVVRDGLTDDETVKEVEDMSKMVIAGSDQFVDLPVRKDFNHLCPETILSSLKLLIVQGMKIVPVPKQVNLSIFGEMISFKFINEDGKFQEGNPTLSSVLKSCYEYFLKNYIMDEPKIDKRRYRKVILTYPNVYNSSHQTFLKNHVFLTVFQESGRAYFENIIMESESNCVLYYYLSKRKTDNTPEQENILVIDVGAGTLDISYAKVAWNWYGLDMITPKNIEIINRDGIAMAGDTLDKAIALQIHDLLEKFSQLDEISYSNKIATNSDHELDSSNKAILRKIMFELKITQILNFKKNIVNSDDDEIVEICLGDNGTTSSLIDHRREMCEITLNGIEPIIKVTLQTKHGKIFMGLRKKEWLNLPYLKRFEQLVIEKLTAFSQGIPIAKDLTIVISGRTSLWPSIQNAVEKVFEGNNINRTDDIWPSDARPKAIELKRAVILGAIQKTTTWKTVPFKENAASGIEAIRYQKLKDGSNPNSWVIETFPIDSKPSLTINLANSFYFELGIKTSMDFVAFIGADYYKRDEYIKTEKQITITLEKLKASGDYVFFVKSDKYPKDRGIQLRNVLNQDAAFFKTKSKYWPVRDVQLPEISPDRFNESV